MFIPCYLTSFGKSRVMESCIRSSSFQLFGVVNTIIFPVLQMRRWRPRGGNWPAQSHTARKWPGSISNHPDHDCPCIGQRKGKTSKSEVLWDTGHPEATRRHSYLGLRMWLLMVDCREGLLMVSVATDRVQLNQDRRLPSGWELRMEMLSLEAECRTLSSITMTTTVTAITRQSPLKEARPCAKGCTCITSIDSHNTIPEGS